MSRQAFQVLDRGDQQEFVSRSTEATQAQACHRQKVLGLAEQGLDFLAVRGGDGIGLASHQGSRAVPGVFMDAAQDFSRRVFGAAPQFQVTAVAIAFAGAVSQKAVLWRLRLGQATGQPLLPEVLSLGTDIAVLSRVIFEVRAREGPVLTFSPIPDRDMRINFAINQPTE